MENETMNRLEPVAPIIDDAEKGTLTCPKCGEKGQRFNRNCCMSCGYPFSEERLCKDCGSPVSCGSLLSQEWTCAGCGKTYRKIAVEQKTVSYPKASNSKDDYERKREEKKIELVQSLNVDPARNIMTISLVLSVLVLIMFFLPTSKKIINGGTKDCTVLDLIGKDLMRRVSRKEGMSAAIATMGLCAAIFMPVFNLIVLLKNNPMQRGVILYESIILPLIVIVSVDMPLTRADYGVRMKITAIGILCICACIGIIVMGIATFTRLADQSKKAESCLPYGKEEKYRRMSRNKILNELNNTGKY